MSFTSQLASRNAKSRKSYVNRKENRETGSTVSTSHSITKDRATPGLYTNLPHWVEIRREEKKGRGIWCKKGVKRGSIVLSQRPHVAVLSTRNLPSYCSHCSCASGDDITLKRCSKCKTVWYCSLTCQNNDWKLHKLECIALQNWVLSVPDGLAPGEAIRSLGRLLWGRKVEGETSSWWEEIRALQSHRSSIPTSAIESYTQLAHALARYIQATSPSELQPFGIRSSGDLVELISQFSSNTFTLTSPSLSPLGTCISPVAALFNHSCVPNAVVVFPGQSRLSDEESRQISMHIVVLKDISAGEEILTAYIDTSVPFRLRQQSLKETYNFDCTCPLCATSRTEVDRREALWCPNSCGGVCPFRDGKGDPVPRCANCGVEFTGAALEDVEDKLRIGQEALEKATSLQFSDPARALNLTSHIVPLLSPHMPPSAHPLLALLRLHQTLLIPSLAAASDSSVLDDAIRTGARAVAGLMSIFVEGHPVRCISLAELGKLLAVDESEPPDSIILNPPATQPENFPPSGAARLALAIDTLKRALKELIIGFGETTGGGDIGRHVRETIVRLEEEMNIYGRGVRNALSNRTEM